ncbi:MAG: ATP-binding protein [Gammaproteobacteria bacterium]
MNYSSIREKLSFINQSISKKLLTVVFSIYMLVTLSVTLLHMFLQYKETSYEVKQELIRFESIVKSGLVEAIWNYDLEQVNKILNGITKSETIIGTDAHVSLLGTSLTWQIGVVENKKGEVIEVTEKQPSKKIVGMRLIKHRFNLNYTNLIGKNYNIGQATFYSNNAIILNKVKQSFALIIINAIIKTLALWTFFLWIGYKYLSTPLFEITKSTQKAAQGLIKQSKLEINLKILKNTELEVLTQSFNKMIEHLDYASSQLLQTQNKLFSIIDVIPSGLICINSLGYISEWNDKAEDFLKIKRIDIVNKNTFESLPQYKTWWDLADRAILENKTQKIMKEMTYIKKELKIFDVTVYPVLTSDYIGSVIRIDDITEKSKLEELMAQTEKMASIGGLAAGVAHEINNPLCAILQGAQNIIRRVDPLLESNQKVAQSIGGDMNLIYEYIKKRNLFDFLNGIRESGERASQIVASLLNFRKKSTHSKTETSIVLVIEDSLKLVENDYGLKREFDFKKIEILRNYEENIPVVSICAPEIQQVLINLFKNAAQAMFENQDAKHQLKISVLYIKSDSSQNKDFVKISVQDNGPGISEEIKKRVFEPFFTTKPIGQGTGLGLSLSYKIVVENHKGSFLMESKIGLGTTFIITLPIK